MLSRKNSRKWYVLAALVLLVLFLSGCTQSGHTTTTEGLAQGNFWEKNVVYYFALMLDTFANWFWGQYGLSILLLTVIVRSLILPLTIKQVRSSKAMQALQPELKKLKEKYKDDAKKQQEETMKLFQKHQVNPLAGCLPLIIQMPVFIALYNAIYTSQVIREHSFLWLKLGEPDHLYILPVIAAATTFIQSKMMASQAAPQMKGLMFIFPVLIFVMALNFPAALPLYWIYSNIFTIVQNYFLYGGSKQNKEVPSK